MQQESVSIELGIGKLESSWSADEILLDLNSIGE